MDLVVEEIERQIPYEQRCIFQKKKEKLLQAMQLEDQPDPAVAPVNASGMPLPMQPIPRHFHQEVLDKLMQRIQEATQLQTTEMNAVELLDGILKDAKKPAEPQIPDGIQAALKAAEILKTRLDDAAGAYNEFHELEEQISSLKGQLSDMDSNLDNISNEVDDWYNGFHALQKLPTCTASLTTAMHEIKQRIDQTSVQASMNFDISPTTWGIDHPSQEDQRRFEIAKELDFALGQACEFALMQVLKNGTAFGEPARGFANQGLERFFYSVANQYQQFCSANNLKTVGRKAVYKYFGITG
jgi:hypothetical protein